MIRLRSLVLYRNRPALVTGIDADRFIITTLDGDEKKVRAKDVALVHEGPLQSFASATTDIDPAPLAEAISLLESEYPEGLDLISWKELASLAWGADNPDHILAAWRLLQNVPEVEIVDAGIRIRSTEEISRIREKADRKRAAAEAREEFIKAFKAALRARESVPIREVQTFQPFLDELSRYVRGQIADCQLARDLGLKVLPGAVHQALLQTGLWDITTNPWPERNGCMLSIPAIEGPLAERPDLGIQRVDLTHLDAYAIDNAWSHDPDDAVSIEGTRIWVHIADPAAFIAPDSPLDRQAMERGSTLYLPEGTIPMLPAPVVDNLGLGLREITPALSFGMEIDESGRIIQFTVAPSRIAVRRLSYEEADRLLDAGDALMTALAHAAANRAAFRRRNGAVDIDLPETAIRVENGIIRFLQVPPTRSARIVQEMMILAGEACARWAFEQGIPFPFTSQDPPVSAEQAGCGMGPSESPAENFCRRRVMRASLVSSTCSAHAGLGLSFYSQVTSPLRRYQDLLAHYQIHAILVRERLHSTVQRNHEMAGLLSQDAVAERLYQANLAAARNRQAERDSRAHWTMVFLSTHRDWSGQAIVLDVGADSAQLLIPEFGYECSVRTSRRLMPDQWVRLVVRSVSVPDLNAVFEIT